VPLAPRRDLPGLLLFFLVLLCAFAAPASADHPLEGTLRALHSDDFAAGKSTTNWRLDTGARSIPVLPTSLPALSPENAEVRVESQGGDDDAAVGAVSATGPVQATSPGARRLAVIMVNFGENTRQLPWTPEQVRQAVFTGPASANVFFQEESYGQISLTGKLGDPNGAVFGWYTIAADPQSAPCSYGRWANDAMAAAAAHGFVQADYDHVMYVFPHQTACTWAGLAHLPGTKSWINGQLTVRVMAHELGHNLGLHHAGRLACGTAVISSTCSLVEYGDPFDVMGSYGERHSHSWHLAKLGVLTPGNVQTASASGSYTIRSALLPTVQPTTLRIPRRRDVYGNVLDWYYLEIREPGGVFDAFGSLDFVVNGVSIRLVDDPGQTTVSRLLDTHPGSSAPYALDAALPAGETFSDGATSVTTVTAGGGVATVYVALAGAAPDTQAPTAPSGVTSTLTSAGVRLDWSASSDDRAVALYAVYRDGMPVGTTGATWFEEASVPAGQHVYSVYAEDAAANRSAATAPHVVTVPSAAVAGGDLVGGGDAEPIAGGEAPVGELSGYRVARDTVRPRPWLRVRRVRPALVVLRAGATDDRAVTRIVLRIDGVRRRVRAGSGLRYRWRVSPGRHRVVVRAFDAAGNSGTLVRGLLRR
jgi:hypothetical protein